MRMKDNVMVKMMKFDCKWETIWWVMFKITAGDFQGPGSCPADTKSTPCTNIIEMNTVSDSNPKIKTAHIQQETSDWHTMVFLHAWNDLLTSLAVNIWLMLELMLSLPDLSALQRSNTAEDQYNNWSEKTLWRRGLVQDRLQPEVIICDRRSKDDLNLID